MHTTTKSHVSLVAAVTVLVVAGTAAGIGPAASGPLATEDASVQTEEAPETVWNETFGQSSDDKLKAIVPTDNGGYLLVGQSTTTDNGSDGWLVAVNDSGNREFATTFGGPGEDRVSDVVATDDGFVLAGWQTTDDNGTQGWLLKVDDQGEEQWSQTLGGSKWDGFWKLTEAADGNYVAVGRSHIEAWAVNVDGAGEVAWNRTYAGSGNGSTFGAVTATDDGYLLAGWTNPTNDSETGLAVRVNDSGGEEWSRRYDADPGTRIWAAQTTGDGFLLAGETRPADEQARGWARLIDENGSVETRWTDETPGSRFIDAVPVDDGFLLVGGTNRSDAGSNAVAIRFSNDLESRWEATAGGTQWDLAFSGIATDDGYLLCGATTSGSAGGQDGWLVKLETGNESDA